MTATLSGAAVITTIFVALGLTRPLGEPVKLARIEGRVASISVGTRPFIPGCHQYCPEPGKALGFLTEYKVRLSGVPSDFEIHPTELRPTAS